MRSFITGSFAYGTPRPDSDIDLVVLLDDGDAKELLELADDNDCTNSYGEGVVSNLRFGRLNLICVYDEKEYNIWKRATEFLKSARPVTREFAVAYIARLREQENQYVG